MWGKVNSVTTSGDWEVIRGQVDSAAAVTICGKDVAESCPVSKTDKSRERGLLHVS